MYLRDLDMAGDLWRVSVPIVASMTKSIVIPRSQREGPGNIAGQKTTVRRDGITILGFALNFHTSSSSVKNVVLRSSDPAFIEGTTTNYEIYRASVPADAQSFSQTVTNCVVPLSPAHYNPTPSDGATLQIVTPANVDGGGLLIWGIHGQLDIGGRRSFTGSPANYSTGF